MDATQHRLRTRDAQQPPLIVKANGKQWLVTPDGRVEQVWSDPEVGTNVRRQATRDEDWTNRVVQQSVWNRPQWWHTTVAGERGALPWKEQITRLRQTWIRLWTPVRAALSGRAQALAGVTADRPSGRSLKETFQLGLALGLALGCVSLVLFHQMRPNEPAESLSGGTVSTLPATATVSQRPPAGVVIPSIKVYVLRAGVFAGQQAAQDRWVMLQKHGWTGVVHHGQQVEVWVGTSLTKSGLSRPLEQLHKLGVAADVVTLTWPSRPIPGLTGARSSSVDLCSHWLSGAASALQALIGANADGAALIDAETAYTACKRQVPTASDWNETGQAQLFGQFVRDWDSAFQAAAQHHTAEVNLGVLHALDDLSQVAQIALSK
ncbi:MAG: hypothetical protein K6T26_06750 [Alicyclobacillus sp.]|nr:hypothetical protein [Alicyclobacillus sp.]